MSLIFSDPLKVIEFLEELEIQEKKLLSQSILKIRKMTDDQLAESLKELGIFFTGLRITNKKTLREVSIESGLNVIYISNVERGLEVPNQKFISYYKTFKKL